MRDDNKIVLKELMHPIDSENNRCGIKHERGTIIESTKFKGTQNKHLSLPLDTAKKSIINENTYC